MFVFCRFCLGDDEVLMFGDRIRRIVRRVRLVKIARQVRIARRVRIVRRVSRVKEVTEKGCDGIPVVFNS